MWVKSFRWWHKCSFHSCHLSAVSKCTVELQLIIAVAIATATLMVSASLMFPGVIKKDSMWKCIVCNNRPHWIVNCIYVLFFPWVFAVLVLDSESYWKPNYNHGRVLVFRLEDKLLQNWFLLQEGISPFPSPPWLASFPSEHPADPTLLLNSLSHGPPPTFTHSVSISSGPHARCLLPALLHCL